MDVLVAVNGRDLDPRDEAEAGVERENSRVLQSAYGVVVGHRKHMNPGRSEPADELPGRALTV